MYYLSMQDCILVIPCVLLFFDKNAYYLRGSVSLFSGSAARLNPGALGALSQKRLCLLRVFTPVRLGQGRTELKWI